MTKNWEEKLNSEFNWNEIFGKNSSAQKAIVAFIKQIRQKAIDKTREETLKEVRKNINSSILIDKLWKLKYLEISVNDCIRFIKSLV